MTAPLLPFRIHFDDPALPPLDIRAADPADARAEAVARYPGTVIRKIKLVREEVNG
ncbi:MAG: hypothetical protein QHC90_25735 [Shinella sp.]|nr:hypothetical protein [Shinella sp.]